MIINIAKINFKGTGGGSSDVIIKKLTINPSNVEQVKDKTAKVDGYNPVIAPGYNVDDLYNTITTLNNGEYTPPTPPKDENRLYDGNVDIAGLRKFGWDDESIADLQANVWWYDWEDDNYKADKGIWGNKKGLPAKELYSGDTNIIGVCNPDIKTNDCSKMFYECSKLEFVAKFNTSNITNMTSMFSGCSSLTTIPPLDTHNVTNMQSMFGNCTRLTTIPLFDTSNVTGMFSMFYGCSSLTNIPQLDTHRVNSTEQMFYNCTKLTTIPPLDTHNVTNMQNMFWRCSALTTIYGLDLTSASTTNNMFSLCDELTHVIFTGSLNRSYTGTSGFSGLTLIDYDSVKSILTAASKTNNTNTKTLEFGVTVADPDGTLQNIITICNGKGWTITGLTLE